MILILIVVGLYIFLSRRASPPPHKRGLPTKRLIKFSDGPHTKAARPVVVVQRADDAAVEVQVTGVGLTCFAYALCPIISV